MVDFRKRELAVGDQVVCIRVGYKTLTLATVKKVNPKTIIVEYPLWAGSIEEAKRTSDQVLKI